MLMWFARSRAGELWAGELTMYLVFGPLDQSAGANKNSSSLIWEGKLNMSSKFLV